MKMPVPQLLSAALANFAVLVLAATALPAEAAPPQWVLDGRLTPQAQQLLGAMRRVEDFGLAREDFAESLEMVATHAADSSQLQQVMSGAVLQLVTQLHHGRVDPQACGYELNRQRAPLDHEDALRRLAASSRPLELLASFEPQSPQYRALKRALARYRAIRTDLTTLPPPALAISAGDVYTGAEKLRWLLAELGDAPEPRGARDSESLYDADLAAGVVNFQLRHGLAGDGVLGRRTFAALSVPISWRIRQIELTLERWRWLPDIAAPAVIVNVPQYMLYALPDPADPSAGVHPLKIPVIVGQTERQTPIFDSVIESVIFRPYWDIPTSILHEELLPLISRDPRYLARHDMEIVRGAGNDAQVLEANAAGVAALRTGRARLRQRPGPKNALGLIKFVLPNPYSVYLHSTPETQLFGRERRALSHGCIRVSDAGALAAYLLKDTPGDWSADSIEAATCADATVTVRLAKPVPVLILYGTVVVDTDGAVLFFDDVYGHDRRLETLLNGTS
jgi:murein L,D-transpeptidase YcbB/YkuD